MKKPDRHWAAGLGSNNLRHRAIPPARRPADVHALDFDAGVGKAANQLPNKAVHAIFSVPCPAGRLEYDIVRKDFR
jgi:hypothetical protein